MKPIDLSKLKTELRAISQFLSLAAVYAAEAYATTKWMSRPIVDGHFTPGNVGRYGWKPLAASTIAARTTLTTFNKSQRAKGRRGSKGEKVPGKRVSPALVLSGDLRNAMATTGRAYAAGPDMARATWSVPDYAEYHLPGGASTAGRPPTRDFIKPNAEDVQLIRELIAQRLSVIRGKPSRAPGLRPGAPP
jgi:hypothetical protein